MEHVIVRYSGIGTKSRFVRNQMRQVLRQRVEDRLEYDDLPYEKVSQEPGRIMVETSRPEDVAPAISELPGVASASPALKTDTGIEAMKKASGKFEYGETFGVDANRAGDHDFGSQDIERQLGAHVEGLSGASVDLDDPETLLEVDIRQEDAYLFTERFQGLGGLPVGSQDTVAALISGGIDSPVAAYQMMKRGADILPVYFYNRPVAAEDHLLRFESALKKLRKFHPGKKWEYYLVDMEEINRSLMELERGRMILHRVVMFRAADSIVEKEGLHGLVTGEALGQKSSQTPRNLELTTSESGATIFRPLLGWNKEEITEKAREIGTFEEARIASACSTMAPDQPATSLSDQDYDELTSEVDLDSLVEKAVKNAEKCTLDNRKD